MYELIILSLLMRFPMHGYLIAKITNDKLGPWTKVSNGTLYPLLTRLEQHGLITRTSDGQDQAERSARTFMITDEGRKRFHQLMMDTSSNVGDYQRIFHHKVPYLDLLRPRECMHLLSHYINYCQATVLHLKTEAEDLVHELSDSKGANPIHRELTLSIIERRADHWQDEVNWTMRLREKMLSFFEGKTSGNNVYPQEQADTTEK